MTAVAYAGRSQNPEIIALTHKVVELVMASAARASVVERGTTGARLPQNPKSLEHVFAPMLRGSGTRPRQLREAFARPAFPGIDFQAPGSVIDQAVANGHMKPVELSPATLAALQPGLSEDEIAAIVARILRFRRPGPSGSPTPPAPARVAKELHLKLKRVRCVEQVGWEVTDWDGKDAILYGGLGFDSTLDSPPDASGSSTAHFRKVPRTSAGTFDDDGDVRNFNPDKTFCKWDLSASGPWPRAFVGTIALAEQDSGDEFAELLDSIWNMVKPHVIDLVKLLVAGALAGAAVGASASASALAGALAGAGIGALIGAMVGVISHTLRDDILESADTPVTLTLPSASHKMPGGGDTSDVYTAEYVRRGGTGVYTLDYYWQLVY